MHHRTSMIGMLAVIMLTACGGGSSGGSPGPAPDPMFEGMRVVRYPMGATSPASPASPYAGVLRDCTFSNTRSDSCTFGDLPLIGSEVRDPTIDDVMDRVLVSHAWMGPRFREVLEALPTDMLLMLRAVTAVVISSDVRPSFYWSATGAIYLDPEYIWLTPEERATIPTTPDFRSDFGADLQFAMPWRYVKDDDYAYVRYPYGEAVTRTIDDMIVDIGRLLYHELAHANDFFPPESQLNLLATQRVPDGVPDVIISDDLARLMPLASSVMRGLARVRFHGDDASATQVGYTPDQVAGFFEADQATVFYNYSTEREDLAMLFEILMMRARFDVEMDTAVTNNPQGDGVTAEDYVVAWGQRNRIGTAAIKERARYAVSRILPEVELDAYIDSMPGPRQMRPGENWIENLVLDQPAPERHAHGGPDGERIPAQPVQELHGYH